MNCLGVIANSKVRNYITPEDIREAIDSGIPLDSIRLSLLEILGGIEVYSVEDSYLCSYIAAKGEKSEETS
jgi:hypothetical protein